MAAEIGTPRVKMGGVASVGVPADPLTALRWRASSAPAVAAVDAQIAELRQKQEAALAAFHEKRVALDAQREAALKAAMRELVG